MVLEREEKILQILISSECILNKDFEHPLSKRYILLNIN